MKIRGTLFTKIFAWFFLNLLLIGAMIWAVYEFQIGPGSPFVGPSEQRVRQVAQVISGGLTNRLREDWPNELRKFSEIYKVDFHLVGADGQSLVDDSLKIPEAVREKIATLPRPGPPRERPPSLAEQLKLNEEQQEKYSSVRLERDQALRSIWTNSTLRELPREERFTQSRELLSKIMQNYRDKMDELLDEDQRKKYEEIVQRGTRSSSPFSRRRNPIRPEQITEIMTGADTNKDNQLSKAELEAWLRQRSGSNSGGNESRPTPGGGSPPKSRPSAPPAAVFMIKTDKPKARYWAGVDIPVVVRAEGSEELPSENLIGLRRVQRGRSQAQYFATLVTVSDTMGGAGLFSDPLRWVNLLILAVVLSVLFWLPMVRNITQPIAEITAATEQIAEGNFNTRVSTERTDEIGRVGQAVDHMADRLDGFVKGQRRFLGDISHELCSPIARIQVALGILDQRADDQQKKYVKNVQDEMEHMSELVNELLLFSQESVKPKSVELEPVNLRKIIDRVMEREGAKSSMMNISVSEDISVTANAQRMSLALGNLLRNAIQYAGDAGPINVTARRENETVSLTITDCGPGLPEDCLPKIFDPFYRPELSRGRATGGVGLGLAIVKTCVTACNGTVTCQNRKPSGLEFKIVLEASG
ncbi:MAG: HAMP domain-containing histidine kinase [Verrucomicrobia subdivision 3 bacterium]|nr:HAMP domain-containing histidine kinase [Limisphaerales bacterium]